MTQRPRTIQSIFFYTSLLAVIALVVAILWPYLSALALAAVLAIVLDPVFSRLTRLFRGRKFPAALVTILLLLIVIGLPLSFVGYQVFRESQDLYAAITTNHDQYVAVLSGLFDSLVKPYVPEAQFELSTYVQQSANWFLQHFGVLFTGTAQFFANVFLGLIALFYFLRDGERFKRALISYSPLPDKHDTEIIQRVTTAVHSVLTGSVLIAFIQGVVSGIGFWIFGVPNPALWGSVAAISALIPGLGTSLVLTPAIVYLFVTGQTVSGIGMLLWGLLAVGLIDNILGPTLMGRGTRIHPLLVLFSVIGGIGLFGPLGFIFGPLSVSLLFALLWIYKTYFNGTRAPTKTS